jgi:hypothetical protein
MEPVETKIDEPFGRQPEPVEVTITGHEIDVYTYLLRLERAAGSCGEMIQRQVDRTLYRYPICEKTFKIYPRAVND